MIIYGAYTKNKELSRREIQYCNCCKNTSDPIWFVQYRCWHIWYVLIAVVEKHYYTQCNLCGDIQEVDKSVVEKNGCPISHWEKFSLITSALILFGFLGIVNQGTETLSQLSSSPTLSTKASPATSGNFDYPKDSCGDKQIKPNATWYPVFIDGGNLNEIRNSYCRDAFTTIRKRTRQQTVQVASFTDYNKALEFAKVVGGEVGTNYYPTDSFQAKIKRREAGTPVIDVTFNSSYTFEMIVDTGASGTVISQQMATALNLVPVDKIVVSTASDREVEFPVGYVNSIEVNGAVANNVLVAVGRLELENGLLGHDFFKNYDVTIKQDVVEFRVR